MIDQERMTKWRRAITWLDQTSESELERELNRLYGDLGSQLNLLLATAARMERRQ